MGTAHIGWNAMWMSDVIVVVNLEEMSGSVTSADANSGVIEVTIPSHEVPTISAIEGVSYVRPVISYFRQLAPAA